MPPVWRANRELYRLVRAVPMWSGPVGLGAIRTRIGRLSGSAFISRAMVPPALPLSVQKGDDGGLDGVDP